MPSKHWGLPQLSAATKDSTSIRQVLVKLGLKSAGGNYKTFKIYAEKYQLDTSHFLGRGWNIHATGLKRIDPTPLSEILVCNSNFQSHKLKQKIIAAGIKQKRCEECGWDKLSIDGRVPLELHHINGIHTDNRIDNLKLLCPNCHSLKINHRGRNIKPRT